MTWTFDFIALFVGFVIGILIGGISAIAYEMREGGAWSKGFYDGCEIRSLIRYLEQEKEESFKRK